MKIQPSGGDITQLRRQLMGVSRCLRREATTDDRSWARLLVLGAIDRHGESATPTVLASDERMRSSNLAAALRSLEARKLIVRRPDTEDRRKVRLRLSAAGQRFLDDSRARGELWLTDALDACLTASERTDLMKAGALLDRIVGYSKSGKSGSRK
jgi:DNA-binding MarR family transcriptional regulator